MTEALCCLAFPPCLFPHFLEPKSLGSFDLCVLPRMLLFMCEALPGLGWCQGEGQASWMKEGEKLPHLPAQTWINSFWSLQAALKGTPLWCQMGVGKFPLENSELQSNLIAETDWGLWEDREGHALSPLLMVSLQGWAFLLNHFSVSLFCPSHLSEADLWNRFRSSHCSVCSAKHGYRRDLPGNIFPED